MDSIEHLARQLIPCAPTLVLNSPKNHYRGGEGINVAVILGNYTQHPIVVNKRLQMIFDYKYYEAYELQFQILGPDKNLVESRNVIEDLIG